MAITAELIAALTGLTTALGALYAAYRAARRAERQDEINLLREELRRVSERQADYEKRMEHLQGELDSARFQIYRQREIIAWLRAQIREAGIQLPPLPDELRLSE